MHCDVERLGDRDLLFRLKRCVAEERRVTARLLAHFAEVDARGLYRDQGFNSMFEYAVRGLHMSESEAGLRITVSRLVRQFPLALEMLDRGEIHLTALRLLAPRLTEANLHLLQEARHMSKREVQELLARHFPLPDVPDSIRRLPLPRHEVADWQASLPLEATSVAGDSCPTATPDAISGIAQQAPPPRPLALPVAVSTSPSAEPDPRTQRQPAAVQVSAPSTGAPTKPRTVVHGDSETQLTPDHANVARAAVPTPPCHAGHGPTELQLESGQANVARAGAQTPPCHAVHGGSEGRRARAPASVPLSEGRFKVQFTAGQRLHNKLKQAQELMRHSVRDGDLAVVLEQAVDLLIAERRKVLFGQVAKPRRRTGGKRVLKSRYVPQAVRREVAMRANEQCTFVAPDGRRCSARGRLEIDHRVPHGRGGAATIDNLRVLCRSHNQLMAERVYGRAFMRERIEMARRARAGNQPASTSAHHDAPRLDATRVNLHVPDRVSRAPR